MKCNKSKELCNMQFVKRVKSNGGYLVNKQCFNCGKRDSKAYSFDLVGGKEGIKKLPDFDESLLDDYYSNQEKERKRKYQEDRKEWFEGYSEYLKSDKWKIKRAKVLERDNNICKACETNKATQVHHLSYQFVFDEPLFDLIAICTLCHDKIHKLKDEKNV